MTLYVTAQKSAVLIYFAAEVRDHANYFSKRSGAIRPHTAIPNTNDPIFLVTTCPSIGRAYFWNMNLICVKSKLS
jgi:hypothetical protein